MACRRFAWVSGGRFSLVAAAAVLVLVPMSCADSSARLVFATIFGVFRNLPIYSARFPRSRSRRTRSDHQSSRAKAASWRDKGANGVAALRGPCRTLLPDLLWHQRRRPAE